MYKDTTDRKEDMRRFRSLLFFLIIYANCLSANENQLTIIDSSSGKPLRGVAIFCSGELVGITNDHGQFTLNFSTSSVKILIMHKGYLSKKHTIEYYADNSIIQIDPSNNMPILSYDIILNEKCPSDTNENKNTDHDGEFVIEPSSIGNKTIAEIGQRGIFEDAMNAITAIPSISYVGTFIDKRPSVNGGNPIETNILIDGSPVLKPYQLYQAVSIFDPVWVEYVEIIGETDSVAIGNSLSGSIAVKTKNIEKPTILGAFSTTGINSLIGLKMGNSTLLASAKGTWMDIPFMISGQSQHYDEIPNIKNIFIKYSYLSNNILYIFSNFFAGYDGIIQNDDKGITLGYYPQTEMHNRIIFGNLSFEYKPNATNELFSNIYFNYLDESISGQDQFENSESVSDFGADIGGYIKFKSKIQPLLQLTSGADIRYEKYEYSLDVDVENYLPMNIRPPSNTGFTFSPYTSIYYSIIKDILEGDIGFRTDLYYLKGQDYARMPDVSINPKLNLKYIPIKFKNLGAVEIKAGIGLNSQFKKESFVYASKYSGSPDVLNPDRNLALTIESTYYYNKYFQFTVDYFYKKYWNLFYAYNDYSSINNLCYFSNGEGHAYGTSLLASLALDKYFSVSLSYSYSLARYYYPGNPLAESLPESVFLPYFAPLGYWHYPNYHRFHTIKATTRWSFLDNISIISDFSYATGTPKYLYSRDGFFYDDNNRNPDSFNLNAKINVAGSYKNIIKWSGYISVQNILAPILPVNLYSFENMVDFNLGYPIPSIGFSINY